MQENTIKVKHPEYGLVTFSMMSVRQMEVLNHYKEITKLNDKIKNTKKIKTIIHK
jgi:hypothetical protein